MTSVCPQDWGWAVGVSKRENKVDVRALPLDQRMASRVPSGRAWAPVNPVNGSAWAAPDLSQDPEQGPPDTARSRHVISDGSPSPAPELPLCGWSLCRKQHASSFAGCRAEQCSSCPPFPSLPSGGVAEQIPESIHAPISILSYDPFTGISKS